MLGPPPPQKRQRGSCILTYAPITPILVPPYKTSFAMYGDAQTASTTPWGPGEVMDGEVFVDLNDDRGAPNEAHREHDQPRGSRPDLAAQLFRARVLLRSSASHDAGDDPDLFPTLLPEVDLLLGGGLARGEMVEVIGGRTCGRFSLVLSVLAGATRRGESAALVDLGDQLDPLAAEICGVDLERLLWLRPVHLKQALGGAELLLGTGFDLVVLDLGTPPVPGGRGVEASWLRLARRAQAHRGALLVSTPYRASGTAAQAVLELRARGPGRSGGCWLGRGEEPRLLAGIESGLELLKARTRLRHAGQGVARARIALRAFSPSVATAAGDDTSLRHVRDADAADVTDAARERVRHAG